MKKSDRTTRKPADDTDDMPAEVDFSRGLRGGFAWMFEPEIVRDQLRFAVDKSPFVPFEIRLRDGKMIPVPTRERIWMAPGATSWAFVVPDRGDVEQVYIPLITSIRPARIRSVTSAKVRRKAG